MALNVLLLLLLSASAFADEGPTVTEKLPGSVASFETLLESPEFLAELDTKSRPLDQVLDEVHSFSHVVPYEPGHSIFVTEYFSLRSVLRRPARAVVFLTGPEFRGNFWSIPVEGYNGPEMAARRGFFAYTLDYVGVGGSYHPEDGTKVNFLTQVAPVEALVDRIRKSRRVRVVDLVGEGYGAEIASQLADEPDRIGSVTMSTVVYKSYSPEFLPFFSPEFEGFLRSRPNGYWQPNFLELTLAESTNPDLRRYVLETQANTYPTGPFLQFWDFGLPAIRAASAEVPGLVIAGELDSLPAAGDLEELARDWGGGGELVVIRGANHVPRIGPEEIAEQYFTALFEFIDPLD